MTYPSRPSRPLPGRKSGTTMPVLLNVLVTLLAVSCVVGAGGGFWLFRSFQEAAGPARRAGDWYLSDLRAGNWAGAYGQICAATRRSVTEQEFAIAQQAGPKVTDYEVVGTKAGNDNGRRTATLTLRVTDVSGAVRTQELRLVKEGVRWRPCP
ncbi:hypothetical protein ACFP2T_03115 [Plantactinospora solaniradicis]|uniref:DUF4878 domain-containing protein n=1 Tax=Plantactinospora solaniradicis TaxID=1723736 RepID=A0ABW1K2M9_9ACTN